MVDRHIPEAGDILWLSFSPHAGHEQAGRRPALVISPQEYNAKTGLMLACPITSQVKGFPFEAKLPGECKTQGVVLANHVRALDWRARNAEYIESAPLEVCLEVVALINAIINPS